MSNGFHSRLPGGMPKGENELPKSLADALAWLTKQLEGIVGEGNVSASPLGPAPFGVVQITVNHDGEASPEDIEREIEKALEGKAQTLSMPEILAMLQQLPALKDAAKQIPGLQELAAAFGEQFGEMLKAQLENEPSRTFSPRDVTYARYRNFEGLN